MQNPETLEIPINLKAPFKKISVIVARNIGEKANKLHIFATAWTTIPNLKFKFNGLNNKGSSIVSENEQKFLYLDLSLEKAEEGTPTKNESNSGNYPVNQFFDFDLEKEKIEFNDSTCSIFIIKVSIDETTTPVHTADSIGTKRTVITYEDTDVIDEGKS